MTRMLAAARSGCGLGLVFVTGRGTGYPVTMESGGVPGQAAAAAEWDRLRVVDGRMTR